MSQLADMNRTNFNPEPTYSKPILQDTVVYVVCLILPYEGWILNNPDSRAFFDKNKAEQYISEQEDPSEWGMEKILVVT
jgi:hypothetical protein